MEIVQVYWYLKVDCKHKVLISLTNKFYSRHPYHLKYLSDEGLNCINYSNKGKVIPLQAYSDLEG
jgi:hypothetical protein